MRRFFTEPENIKDDFALIIEDASHITKVLRMNIGDEILLFDGTGYEYVAQLTKVSGDMCEAKIISSEFSAQEPKTKVTVYQGIPKSGKMEGIIQKSVELGVHTITPVSTDRCVSKLDGGKKQAEKLKRWNKIAVEAAKQCGRGILPRVTPPLTFDEAIAEMQNSDLALMPYEMLAHMGVSNIKDTLCGTDAQNISVIIGPEGGFSNTEAEKAKEKGLKLVSLGRRILRTETVSHAVLAMIMYEKDEM